MRNNLKVMLVITLGIGAVACNSGDKKPDAVVIQNDQVKENPAATEDLATDTANLTTAYQDTAIQNYNTDEPETANQKDQVTNTNEAADPEEKTDRSTNNEVVADSKVNSVTRTESTTPFKPVVRTRASVQQQLAHDARLAKQMPLARFGRYMERRADYYRSFGDISYEDKTVEIKITREELKIETPEGKYKRESDERKIKTDAGKVKQETSR